MDGQFVQLLVPKRRRVVNDISGVFMNQETEQRVSVYIHGGEAST